MVIGTGLMAKAFKAYATHRDVVIFASGVSNSTETSCLAFEREYKLLQDTLLQFPKAKLIYFSTCSITDESVNERPYVTHKLNLEDYIVSHADDYLIFRVSNVVGFKGNAHTILNFLVSSVKTGSCIELWEHAERNLIDVDDVKLIVDGVLNANQLSNTIINIALGDSVLVKDIVAQIEVFFDLTANIRLIDKGNALSIDTDTISSYLEDIETRNGKGLDYIKHLLHKYYKGQ